MGYDIGLILPAHNEEERIIHVLDSITTTFTPEIENAPTLEILPILIDSCSDDSTYDTMYWQVFARQILGTIGRVEIKRVKEKGLAFALKTGFEEALSIFTRCYHILKADVDSDLTEVMKTFVPAVIFDPAFVVSKRKREFLTDHPEYSREQQYEKTRWEDIANVMKTEYPNWDLDPSTCGTQLIRYDVAMKLLKDERFQNYDRPWGLDFLTALLAPELAGWQISLGGVPSFAVMDLDGTFDPGRRPLEKIQSQYDTYLEIIAMLKGKEPQELSHLYRENP